MKRWASSRQELSGGVFLIHGGPQAPSTTTSISLNTETYAAQGSRCGYQLPRFHRYGQVSPTPSPSTGRPPLEDLQKLGAALKAKLLPVLDRSCALGRAMAL